MRNVPSLNLHLFTHTIVLSLDLKQHPLGTGMNRNIGTVYQLDNVKMYTVHITINFENTDETLNFEDITRNIPEA